MNNKKRNIVIIAILSVLLIAAVVFLVLFLVNRNAEDDTSRREKNKKIKIDPDEIEYINKEFQSMFWFEMPEFDSKTATVKSFMLDVFIEVYDSQIYNYYFKNEWYSADETPDPLGRFSSNPYGKSYVKYAKKNIDWLMVNVFNMSESEVKKASVDDYLCHYRYNDITGQKDIVKDENSFYYYDGYFYIKTFEYGSESSNVFSDLQSLGDELYSVKYVYYDYDDPIGEGTAVIKPKMLNGEKHWTIVEIKHGEDVKETPTQPDAPGTEEPSDPYSVTEKDLEDVKRDLTAIFQNYVYDYDCDSTEVSEFVGRYLFPICDSPVYDYYFGTPTENGRRLKWINCQDEPDPLGRFPSNFEYIVLSKDKIDWLMKNVFNMQYSKVDNASVDDYLYTYIYDDEAQEVRKVRDDYRYYYNGNIYQTVGGYGLEENYFTCENLHYVNDGVYEVTVVNHWTDYLGTGEEGVSSIYRVTLLPKTLNGERHWTLLSSSQVG